MPTIKTFGGYYRFSDWNNLYTMLRCVPDTKEGRKMLYYYKQDPKRLKETEDLKYGGYHCFNEFQEIRDKIIFYYRYFITGESPWFIPNDNEH